MRGLAISAAMYAVGALVIIFAGSLLWGLVRVIAP